MILHASDGSPWWVSSILATILILHIAAGSIGIVSGFAALFARKGERFHRRAGNLFVAAMLVMSGMGAAMAASKPDRISTTAGVLTFYLVATAWATVKRGEHRIGRFERFAFVIASAIAVAGATIGAIAFNSPRGQIDGLPYQPAFLFAFIATIAALSDLRMLRRGGIAGGPRIARHLWRMCVALLIAAMSFFLGQQKVMPAFMRGSPLLFVPEIAVLALMVFYLFRARLSSRFNPKEALA